MYLLPAVDDDVSYLVNQEIVKQILGRIHCLFKEFVFAFCLFWFLFLFLDEEGLTSVKVESLDPVDAAVEVKITDGDLINQAAETMSDKNDFKTEYLETKGIYFLTF